MNFTFHFMVLHHSIIVIRADFLSNNKTLVCSSFILYVLYKILHLKILVSILQSPKDVFV